MVVEKQAISLNSKSDNKHNEYKSLKDFAKENWLLIGAIIYIISPFDFLPDILPAFGFVDDIGVLLVSLAHKYIMYKKRE